MIYMHIHIHTRGDFDFPDRTGKSQDSERYDKKFEYIALDIWSMPLEDCTFANPETYLSAMQLNKAILDQHQQCAVTSTTKSDDRLLCCLLCF